MNTLNMNMICLLYTSSEEKNAGFTKGVPWLRVNPNYHRINIESQIRSEDSLFSYYKELIALRKSAKYQEVLTYGEIVPEALKRCV